MQSVRDLEQRNNRTSFRVSTLVLIPCHPESSECAVIIQQREHGSAIKIHTADDCPMDRRCSAPDHRSSSLASIDPTPPPGRVGRELQIADSSPAPRICGLNSNETNQRERELIKSPRDKALLLVLVSLQATTEMSSSSRRTGHKSRQTLHSRRQICTQRRLL